MVGRTVALWGGPCDGTHMYLNWEQREVLVPEAPALGPGQRSPRARYWWNSVSDRMEWDRTYIDKDYYA